MSHSSVSFSSSTSLSSLSANLRGSDAESPCGSDSQSSGLSSDLSTSYGPSSPVSRLSVRRLVPEAILPTRAHPDDAGLDLYALVDEVIAPAQGKLVRTGIAMAIPAGFVGIIADRSSLAKRGLKTAGGIIDAGYRGEIQVILWNLSAQEIRLARGDRVAQLLICPIATPVVQEVFELDQTARGTGGFGSTGQ